MTCEHPTLAAYIGGRWLQSARLPEFRRLVALAQEPVTEAGARVDQLRAAIVVAEHALAAATTARDTAVKRAAAERRGSTADLPLNLREQVEASAATAVLAAEKASAVAHDDAAVVGSLIAELAEAEARYATIAAGTPGEADLLAAFSEFGARIYDKTQVEFTSDPTPAQIYARWLIAGGPTPPITGAPHHVR